MNARLRNALEVIAFIAFVALVWIAVPVQAQTDAAVIEESPALGRSDAAAAAGMVPPRQAEWIDENPHPCD